MQWKSSFWSGEGGVGGDREKGSLEWLLEWFVFWHIRLWISIWYQRGIEAVTLYRTIYARTGELGAESKEQQKEEGGKALCI